MATSDLSSNFPRVPPACKSAAEPFFACLYEHGKKLQQQDDSETAVAPADPLAVCKKSMEAYNACVDDAVAKTPKKLFRVPEAYRVRDE